MKPSVDWPAFDYSVPVLVVGGGACGCIAALAAKGQGAQVMLVEQDDRPMGSTGMSQGLVCAAGTRAQAAHDVIDDADTFYADIMAKTRGQADPVIARLLADRSGPTLDWMAGALDLPWTLDTAFRPSYGHSTFRVHGWHGHGGQDMVDLLHARLQEADVDVVTGAQLVAIHTASDDPTRIAGVSLRRADGSVEHLGCGVLILACGGFAGDAEMVARHIPDMAQARNNGHEGSHGTAVRLGQGLGAALGDLGAYQGYGMLTDPQGISVPPGFLVEGGLLINGAGERFCDESEDIAGVVLPVLAQPGDHVWVVFDTAIEDACAHIPETRDLRALGAMRIGGDAAGLAQVIGVPAAALAETLDHAHQACADRRKDEQGRDWGTTAPPSGDLRALRVVGAIYHTQGGLQIDDHAHVVTEQGTSFANLYAGGGAARSVSGPAHWGYLPAMGLCTAVTLGRVAGEDAARQVAHVAQASPTGG